MFATFLKSCSSLNLVSRGKKKKRKKPCLSSSVSLTYGALGHHWIVLARKGSMMWSENSSSSAQSLRVILVLTSS